MRPALVLFLVPLFAARAETVPAPALPSFGEAVHDSVSILAWPAELTSPEALLCAATAMGTVSLLRADTRLYARTLGLRFTVHHRSMFNYTLRAGDGLVDLAVMGAFAFGDRKAQRTSIAGTEALISAAMTSVLLKHLFRVERPQVAAAHKTYFSKLHADAFPSGHTMGAFATASVISAEYPSAAPYAYGVAGLVGFSVIKRGWHWPSDVLAGGVIGYLIGRVSSRVNQRHVTVQAGGGALGLRMDL